MFLKGQNRKCALRDNGDTMKANMGFVTSATGILRGRVKDRASERTGQQPRMKISVGQASLYGGIGLLTGLLTNRIALTGLDKLSQTQSRSDILGVICGATLLLYGVGKAEIMDGKQAVKLDGVDIREGFDDGDVVSKEVEWTANALLTGVPNLRSFMLVQKGKARFLYGRFAKERGVEEMKDGGVVMTAIEGGKRSYMADMKVVPVRETEFGMFPDNCQVCG